MHRRFIRMALLGLFLLASLGIACAAADGYSDQLVIYHWWTAGGERLAIDSIFEIFEAAYPNIEVVENPISGGGGGTMRAQIKTMIMAGNPPDTFQVCGGKGMLASYMSVLEPVDDLWDESFPVPDAIKEAVTVDGHQWGIPINVMRCNMLFYNEHIIDELDIDLPFATLDDFYAACETIKDAGYIPLAHGVGAGATYWWQLMYDSILLAVPSGGSEYLMSLYAGTADPATDPAIREALEVLKMLAENYINADYAARTDDMANNLVVNGEAAFWQSGTWGKGFFTSKGAVPLVDFGSMAFPGTTEYYMCHSDCFVLPKGVNHPEAARAWLEIFKTPGAEMGFCAAHGSTVIRTDIPLGGFDEMAQQFIEEYRDPSLTVVASPWGGPPEAYLSLMPAALSAFGEHLDVDRGVQDLADAYADLFE